VLIVKENHGFDNYFGRFPGADGMEMAHAADPPPQDYNHRHAAWLTRATTAQRSQYNESDIPAYWAYARQFTLCDRYFTAVAGPSTPNHLMLIAADSPFIDNPPRYHVRRAAQTLDIPSLPSLLDDAGLSWKNYGGYAFDYITNLRNHPSNLHPGHVVHTTTDAFLRDARAGRLPAVSWVYGDEHTSEHPTQKITDGMQWTVERVNAIVEGGLWPRTAIFITWDDWGGWYDHVDPPTRETWEADDTQFSLGGRVGCLVLSPYAKSGAISHAEHSHLSLVKFCETTFGLPTLNERDAQADDMGDCFDFTRAPANPPSATPAG
jgi:phospholipase C